MRRQICLTLEEMGIQPESSHHEQGPGQHEIDFRYADEMCIRDRAEDGRAHERRYAADHVYRSRTGEVMEAKLGEPATAPDPVTGEDVYKRQAYPARGPTVPR